MHVTLTRSKTKANDQTNNTFDHSGFYVEIPHESQRWHVFLNSMIFYRWYVACFRCVGWYMSCGACWNPQIFVCFCAVVVPGGGIRRHMTETPDVFTPSQFDQASPSPDFVALLEDINTQPARSSVHCLSRVDIWRDRCDRRSCIIFASCVNFSENRAINLHSRTKPKLIHKSMIFNTLL